MGLDNFKTGNDKGSGSGSSEFTRWTDEWGKSRIDLIKDPDWVKSRLEEGWSVEKFLEELDTHPSTVAYMFQRAVQCGAIDYSEIPDYNGPNYTKKEFSWYVKMAVEHSQFPRVVSDNFDKLTGYGFEFPDEFKEVIVEDGLDLKSAKTAEESTGTTLTNSQF